MKTFATKTERFILLTVCIMFTVLAFAQESGTTNSYSTNKEKIFTGSVYLETNYGNKHDEENKDVWDFPHIVAEGKLNLGKNWYVAAEFEYERIKEDCIWENSFKNNFTTNKLYIAKQFCKGATIKLGIQELPIGIVNRGGPALTIYDPKSESAIIPMTWHEFGVGISGEIDSWGYNIVLPFYFDAPIKRSKPIGAATRIENHGITDGLTLGASGFWGTSSVGMSKFCQPEETEYTDGIAIAAFDAEWTGYGIVASGSAIYSTDNNARSAGIEGGFDIMSCFPALEGKASVIPFVRYDGIFIDNIINKVTVGINISPLKNLTLKAEWSSKHFCGSNTLRRTDIGIGYMLEF